MALKRRSVFRPCIDLHNGEVKQIVGGTLSDCAPDALKTNFVSRLVLAMCDEPILISNLANPQESSRVFTDNTTSKEDMSLNWGLEMTKPQEKHLENGQVGALSNVRSEIHRIGR